MAGLTHQLSARVVVFVDPMAKSHQTNIGVFIFNLANKFAQLGDPTLLLDIVQHLKTGFVGAAVCRPPERSDTRSDTGKRIGARRTGQPYGRG